MPVGRYDAFFVYGAICRSGEWFRNVPFFFCVRNSLVLLMNKSNFKKGGKKQ